MFNIHTPFPVTEYLLCGFSAYLADQGLTPQTGVSYLSAVRSMQISLGLPDPRDESSLPYLKRVQAGIRRAQLNKAVPSRVRLPVTASLLEQIRVALDDSTYLHKMVVWAVACVAFFGFFRLGELLLDSPLAFNSATCLAWGDVAVDDTSNPSQVKIHLKKSKCDQFGRGVDVFLGRTDTSLCPIAAITSYMVVRGSSPGPFFVDDKKEALSKGHFVKAIRDILQSLGLPHHQYAGHSFRIGAATSAALAGVEDSTIQALGRWHSAAFLQYVRLPRDTLAALSPRLAAQARSPLQAQGAMAPRARSTSTARQQRRHTASRPRQGSSH